MSSRIVTRISVLLMSAGMLAATPAGSPKVDFNNDGMIALGEYLTVVDRFFAKADANQTGQLSRDEWPRRGLYSR